jgi:2-alkenal reductase
MKRSTSLWLSMLMFVSMLFGVAGGGLMGGIAGYYVASNQKPAAVALVSTSPTAAPLLSQRTSTAGASVTQASAVTSVVKSAEPAVVTIRNTMQVRSRRGSNTGVAEGSGVIIDAQGHILTNAHVVQGAQQLEVVFNDGTRTSAQLVGADATRDIAVLQVSGNVPAYLSLGDSSALELGETVIAIGSPLGTFSGSVTVGVVSGLDRSVQGASQDHLIQTDAAINSGNSGGPLLNLNGEVIGINTLVVRRTNNGDIAEGLGFAIPSNTLSTVVQQILGHSS